VRIEVNQFRNFAVWIVIALLLFALFSLFQGQVGRSSSTEISYSEFLDKVNAGNVTSVTIAGSQITGKMSDGKSFDVYSPPLDMDLIKTLNAKKVEIIARPPQSESLLTNALIYWLPMVLLIGVWVFFIRQMQAGSGKAMGFGKSKAKLLTERHGRVTFEDVAGVDEAKEDLVEIVARFRRARFWLARRAPARRCWRAPSLAKRTCRFSPFRVPTSWKCSWAWALPACATCSSRRRRMRLASSSSMKSTQLAVTVAQAWAAATMSANRPSTSCWLRWMGSRPMKVSS
jgi:cell division protease FtsH